METSNQVQFRQQLVVQCIKAKDASDVAPNLEEYQGKTLEVFGCTRQVNATVFALSGGKDNVLQDELPDAGSKSLMCSANDPSVNSKLAYCVQVYGGFNIVSFAVLEVEVVKRGSDCYPEYCAIVKSGDVLSPPALSLLSQRLSLGAR